MKWLSILLAGGCLLFVSVSTLLTHGGGDLIAGPVPAGPYMVSVWLNPPDPRVEEAIHYTVGLADPSDRQPMLDAEIMVEMRNVSDGELVASGLATTEQSVNRLFYETDLAVPAPGAYETTFQIAGPQGQGTLAVVVDVSQQARINWLYPGLAGLAIIVLFGWWQTKRQR